MKLTLNKQILLLLSVVLFSSLSLDAQTYVRYVTQEDLQSKVVYADSVLTSIQLPRGLARLDNYPKFNAAAYELSQVLKDSSKELLQVWVCGSASPDGLWAYNVKLSQARTDSAVAYLKEVMDIPDSLIHKESLNEDWDRLAELVEESDIPCRNQVLEIIANKSWGERKTALQELQDGKVWDILVEDFFPKLRCVRFAIYCEWDQSKPHLSMPRDTVYVRDTVVLVKETVYVTRPDTVVISRPDTIVVAPVTKEQVYEQYREESIKKSRRQIDWLNPNVMAVKTNLVSDALTIPSLGVEVQLYKGLSLDISGAYGFYNLFNKDRRNMSAYFVSPELRWWFGEHPMQRGSFIGLHANLSEYSLEWTDKVAYQNVPGKLAWSAGFTYGACACLDRKAHWGLEFVIGVGYGQYYQNIGSFDNSGKFQVKETGSPKLKEHFGVTKLALNLVYWFSLAGKKK